MMDTTTIRIRNLEKSHGGMPTLMGIDLDVDEGEILSLLGPSGGGKTTLLRILAGLEAPDAGELFSGRRNLLSLPPHRRGIGMVFQDGALFPHMTVEENIAFGLVEGGWKKGEIASRVSEMLELVGLPGFGTRKTRGLSGGECQRVALARSLAPSPKVLLLDEPLAALDRDLRERLAADLRRILKDSGVTALFVTHDQDEAATVGDRVALLMDGRLIRAGSPKDLMGEPKTLAEARFFGHRNLLPVFSWKDSTARTAIGEIPDVEGEGDVLLIGADALLPGSGPHDGEVLSCRYGIHGWRLEISSKGQLLSFRLSGSGPFPATGSGLSFGLDPTRIRTLSC